MLHRDIKAANIALDGEGTAKLIDCGLSKSVDDIARSLMSITGGATLGRREGEVSGPEGPRRGAPRECAHDGAFPPRVARTRP